MTTSAIVAKLWNLCNILKDDGVTYHQYVTELTSLLFLKMAKEAGTEDQLPVVHRWGEPPGPGEIIDPYCAGTSAFEDVLDQIEAGADGLLAELQRSRMNPA